MTTLYVSLFSVYLIIGYLGVKNALEYVRDSKEFTEEYNRKFDYYLDTVIFTLFWLPIVICVLISKK